MFKGPKIVLRSAEKLEIFQKTKVAQLDKVHLSALIVQ